MNHHHQRHPLRRSIRPFALLLPLLAVQAYAYSGHAVRPSPLGTPQLASAMEATLDLPGPVTVETILAADGAVPLSGLLTMDPPKVEAAGLEDRDEPMQIYFHVLRHPTKGVFLVDTGVARVLRDEPSESGVGWLVRRELHLEKITFRTDLAAWLAKEPVPPVRPMPAWSAEMASRAAGGQATRGRSATVRRGSRWR